MMKITLGSKIHHDVQQANDNWFSKIINLDERDLEVLKEYVSVDELLKCGIEIECQANGGNNPEDLEDGIFIPYRWLKSPYEKA